MSKRRLLVVDDEVDLCEILRFNLEAEGYHVDTALSAEEALALARSGPAYHLMLLDVMLPRLSGLQLAATLRAEGCTTPIIFLTALGDHDHQMQGFSVGADDYIAKPFATDTLLARIRAVLRRTAIPSLADATDATDAADAGAGHPLVPADCHFASLTRREYLILQLLASHPGRYFSRGEILATVWPGDTLVLPRSVDVHIARLRKKMGPDAHRLVGKTGFGYAFN